MNKNKDTNIILWGPLHSYQDVKDDSQIIVCGISIPADNPTDCLRIVANLLHLHVKNIMAAETGEKIAIQWCDRSFSIIFEWGMFDGESSARVAIDSATYDRIKSESGMLFPMIHAN